MTVFKTFWQVINKYKGTVLMYTIMLIIFGGINMSTNESSTQFVDSKPKVYIVNEDSNGSLALNLVEYFEENSMIVSLSEGEYSIDDALFYRDVNYVIYIPKNYTNLVMQEVNPIIDIKSTGDYQASLAEMMLKRYLKIQNMYVSIALNDSNLISLIDSTLEQRSSIEVTSKVDTNKLTKVASYFSFASYSIMAVVIFVICLVLSSFKEKTVKKRTIISGMNYVKHNRYLLLASLVYAVFVWVVYVLLGIFLLGDIMFSVRGFLYMLNAFLFTCCCLTLALFISTLIQNKEAVNGIVNVIALGSSFLCGAFVPAEWLPSFVLKIAHFLPAYWYIHSNDLLTTIENMDCSNLQPVYINMLVVVGFSIFFILLNNIVSKYKQKID